MPSYLSNQTVGFLGRLVLGGLIVTGAVGGGIRLSEFNSASSVKKNMEQATVAADWLNLYVTATGSTTQKYPAVCVANPLAGIGLGSGTVVRLTYQAGNTPAAVGGDIGFVKSCGNSGGSGQTLINDVCTSTGCLSTYTTGTALWNGADYIKLTLRADPTASYTARVRLQYEDLFGE